jgi:hypothetical protein
VSGKSVQRPDWQVAIVDGEPRQVLNKAMVLALVIDSPLGEVEAMRRLRAAYPDVDWETS